MPDYKAMYFELMARVADATDILVQAQLDAEKKYIESEPIKLDRKTPPKGKRRPCE